LRETGQLAPAEERFISTLTRTAKTPGTHEDLDQQWRATASELGLGRPAVAELRAHRSPMVAATARAVLEGLTEFDATFPARDARAVALERSAGAPIPEALELLRDLRSVEEILVLADGTGTTREHRGRERTTVAIAERLADTAVPPLASHVVAAETERLDRDLAARGGSLSAEQSLAIELACGTRALVVIEGQAGTGKSMTLTGIARAHQACGREIVVTSTAAVAAERLAGELAAAGVDATAYSTAALHAAITTGQVQLDTGTTIVHDEAALASTREQQQLFSAVEGSGARLIEIGDPQQSQPVGAGGLWSDLERGTRDVGAHAELTRNQRALDAADRRDQARFREGEYEQAIRGYAARDHIHIGDEPARAEDAALDAAQADREARKRTIVIAQTSNEHLDQLNARAQAIRRQHGELDRESLPLPRRPYELHPGDDVQVRRTARHPDVGWLRNGTTARVGAVDREQQTIRLELADGRGLDLDREQVARADLRLAYVQHPFPAQGRTTDMAHVIVGEHATREGTYVAITRARQSTDIYAATERDDRDPPTADRLSGLAERISRAEPEVPSIRTPLAHERALAQQPDAPGQQPDPTLLSAEMDNAPVAEHDTDPEPAEQPRRWPSSLEREAASSTAELDDTAVARPGLGFEP
jgi:ATP-dependent exoDNAse (exonuclease V) alpha subunit